MKFMRDEAQFKREVDFREDRKLGHSFVVDKLTTFDGQSDEGRAFAVAVKAQLTQKLQSGESHRAAQSDDSASPRGRLGNVDEYQYAGPKESGCGLSKAL